MQQRPKIPHEFLQYSYIKANYYRKDLYNSITDYALELVIQGTGVNSICNLKGSETKPSRTIIKRMFIIKTLEIVFSQQTAFKHLNPLRLEYWVSTTVRLFIL